MSRKKDIDQLDCQILTELFKDSSITNKDLSEKLGLTPGPTLNRVNALKKKGYISKFTIQLNDLRLNLIHFNMVISISKRRFVIPILEILSTFPFIYEIELERDPENLTSDLYHLRCLTANEIILEEQIIRVNNIEHVSVIGIRQIFKASWYKSHFEFDPKWIS